jgi:hypothetical protein
MKIVFLPLLFFLNFCLFAQNESEKTSKIKDKFIIDVYHDNWLGKPDSIKTKWQSRGTAISFFYDYQLGKSNFSIAAGASIASHNILMNGAIVSTTDSAGRAFSSIDVFDEPYKSTVKKNKISTNFVEVPVEVRFRTKPNEKGHSMNVFVGAKVGYLINAHSKTIDKTGKYKSFNFSDINNIRYGTYIRAGYGKVSLYGFYSLSEFFKEKQGIIMNPFSLGVSYSIL